MGQDIRKMLQDPIEETSKLRPGHESRFEMKLEAAFSEKRKKNKRTWLRIAAAILVFVGVGYFGYKGFGENSAVETGVAETETIIDKEEKQGITLGDISPALKKMEEFYTTGINVQLASLQVTDTNKELIEGYMKRLRELDAEYERLNKELNEVGPTEATVTALIDNLKLRMDLLFKLKNKLKELKELENEQFKDLQA